MFNKLVRVKKIQNPQTVMLAIEGFFDTFTKVILNQNVEKKPDVDSRKYNQDITNIISQITNTYGNPKWVQDYGLTKATKISGQGIFPYIEVNNSIPFNLESACSTHISTVDTILKEWSLILTKYYDVLKNAFEQAKKEKTTNTKVAILVKLLTKVEPPDLTKNISVVGLMGTILVHDRKKYGIMIGHNKESNPIQPLPENTFPIIVKCIISLLNAYKNSATYFSVSNSIDEDAFDLLPDGDDIWDELCDTSDHVADLFFSTEQWEMFLRDVMSLRSSLFYLAKALETWLHRSMR